MSAWRAAGLTVGFTCGAFDILHAGHIDYLEKAHSYCDRLIVAVNSDTSIRSYKSPLRPINPEANRLSLIAALACVDAAVLMSDTRPLRMLESLRPDVYIKGGDYKKEQLGSASLIESYGGRCVVIPVEHEISTTEILARIVAQSAYAEPEVIAPQGRSGLILLDRDGTLIEDVPFLKFPSKVKLIPGVGEGLRLLQEHGFPLAIVTNQQGLGLGYFDYHQFVAVNSEMLRQLAKYQVRISRFYFCPHSLADNCACRKPAPGLIERALADFNCKPEACYFIGDSTSDLAAATAAGCKGIVVANPNDLNRSAQSVSLLESARAIISDLPSMQASLQLAEIL